MLKLKRVATLGHPVALLPENLGAGFRPDATMKVLVAEEPIPGQPASQIEWETIAQRWIDGGLVSVSVAEVSRSLPEPAEGS